jgi:hypothetical protein
MNDGGTVGECCSGHMGFSEGEEGVDDTFHKDQAASTKDPPEMTRSGRKFSLTNQDSANNNEKRK